MNAAALVRMPRFKYLHRFPDVLLLVDVDTHADLLIVGEPENGCYEWVIVEHGRVAKHSDVAYGMRAIALRDGLIAFHGLPQEDSQVLGVQSDLIEALHLISISGGRDERSIARAALAKVGL